MDNEDGLTQIWTNQSHIGDAPADQLAQCGCGRLVDLIGQAVGDGSITPRASLLVDLGQRNSGARA
jgi:hypothetical protein